MKNTFILLFFLMAFSLWGCKKDDGRACTTCNSPQTTNFEVCDDGDGNATVNGENTGTSFDVYIADLEAAGATCGG